MQENTTPPGVQRPWSSPDEYDQAVTNAGVTELLAAPCGNDLPDDVAAGRLEDSDPLGASR